MTKKKPIIISVFPGIRVEDIKTFQIGKPTVGTVVSCNMRQYIAPGEEWRIPAMHKYFEKFYRVYTEECPEYIFVTCRKEVFDYLEKKDIPFFIVRPSDYTHNKKDYLSRLWRHNDDRHKLLWDKLQEDIGNANACIIELDTIKDGMEEVFSMFDVIKGYDLSLSTISENYRDCLFVIREGGSAVWPDAKTVQAFNDETVQLWDDIDVPHFSELVSRVEENKKPLSEAPKISIEQPGETDLHRTRNSIADIRGMIAYRMGVGFEEYIAAGHKDINSRSLLIPEPVEKAILTTSKDKTSEKTNQPIEENKMTDNEKEEWPIVIAVFPGVKDGDFITHHKELVADLRKKGGKNIFDTAVDKEEFKTAFATAWRCAKRTVLVDCDKVVFDYLKEMGVPCFAVVPEDSDYMCDEYAHENDGEDSFEDAWNSTHLVVEEADCCVIELTSLNVDMVDVSRMLAELEDTGISPTSVAANYKGCIFGLNSYGPTTVTLDSAAVEEFSATVLSRPGNPVRPDQTLSSFINLVNMCRTPEAPEPIFIGAALKSFLSVVKKRMWDMSSGTRLDVAREIKEVVANALDAHVKHITDMEWLAEKLKTVDDEDAKTSILKLQEKLTKGHE